MIHMLQMLCMKVENEESNSAINYPCTFSTNRSKQIRGWEICLILFFIVLRSLTPIIASHDGVKHGGVCSCCKNHSYSSADGGALTHRAEPEHKTATQINTFNFLSCKPSFTQLSFSIRPHIYKKHETICLLQISVPVWIKDAKLNILWDLIMITALIPEQLIFNKSSYTPAQQQYLKTKMKGQISAFGVPFGDTEVNLR